MSIIIYPIYIIGKNQIGFLKIFLNLYFTQ